MDKPKGAKEMRELVLTYIDALLHGGIPKIKLDEPKEAPVDMIWYMNAEELLTVTSKRLCRKADPATQEIVKRMRTLVLDHCPEFRGLMAPPCAFMDECPEMEPCKEGQA